MFRLDNLTRETTEGPWDQVLQVIGFAHTLVHQAGIARIQTDVRVTTRYVTWMSHLENAGYLPSFPSTYFGRFNVLTLVLQDRQGPAHGRQRCFGGENPSNWLGYWGR